MQLNLRMHFNKPILPISTNRSHYRTGVLTADSRKYRSSVFTQIRPYKDDISDFRDYAMQAIDTGLKCLKLDIRHSMPESRYYTKKGLMSKIAGDADNYTKLLQDFLFNERYMQSGFKGAGDAMIHNIAINDAFIKDCRAIIVPHKAKEWVIEVTVSIVDINSL